MKLLAWATLYQIFRFWKTKFAWRLFLNASNRNWSQIKLKQKTRFFETFFNKFNLGTEPAVLIDIQFIKNKHSLRIVIPCVWAALLNFAKLGFSKPNVLSDWNVGFVLDTHSFDGPRKWVISRHLIFSKTPRTSCFRKFVVSKSRLV